MKQQAIFTILVIGAHLVQALPHAAEGHRHCVRQKSSPCGQYLSYVEEELHLHRRTEPFNVKKVENLVKEGANVDPSTITTHHSNPDGGGLALTAKLIGPESGHSANDLAHNIGHEADRAYQQSTGKPVGGRSGEIMGAPMTTVDVNKKQLTAATQFRAGTAQASTDEFRNKMTENTRMNVQKSTNADAYNQAEIDRAAAGERERKATEALNKAKERVGKATDSAERKAAGQEAAEHGKAAKEAAKARLAAEDQQRKLERGHVHPGQCSECGADLTKIKTGQPMEKSIQASAGRTVKEPGFGSKDPCVNCAKKQQNFEQTNAVKEPDATTRNCARGE